MKYPKFWIGVLVAGVVCNALDFLVQGQLLTKIYYSKLDSMRQDTNPAWFVLGDFVAILVLAWVLYRVLSVFCSGAKAGAVAGFFLGVIVNFPTFHFIHLMMRNFPYPLVWIGTLYGIAWYVLAGAILGSFLKKPVPAGAAAAG